MKYIIYALVLALTWAHIAPHVGAYYQFKRLKENIPACTLDMEWSWYYLEFKMGAVNCVDVSIKEAQTTK